MAIKDAAAIVTSVAAIIVTVIVACATYQFNERQATITQGDLKRSWLVDFTDSDDAKRKIGAIKLAAYGNDALPAIRDSLSVKSDRLMDGGVQTALTIYESQPENRAKLLKSMIEYFDEVNPNLRLGVLEFYTKASKELSGEEQKSFFEHLQNRLQPEATNCVKEDSEFMLKAAKFLSAASSRESLKLLLGIARNCPHEAGNLKYESARNQAFNVLPSLAVEQHLSKTERDEIVSSLTQLDAGDSELLKRNLKAAIDRLQKITTP